jgi:hypothetical protein
MHRFDKIHLILLLMGLLSFILLLSSCAWEFMVRKEKNDLDIKFIEGEIEKIR